MVLLVIYICCGVYPCPGTHTNSPVLSSTLSRSGHGRCHRSSPRGWRLIQPCTTIVKGGDCPQVWCQPPAPPPYTVPLFFRPIIYCIPPCTRQVLTSYAHVLPHLFLIPQEYYLYFIMPLNFFMFFLETKFLQYVCSVLFHTGNGDVGSWAWKKKKKAPKYHTINQYDLSCFVWT